MTKPNDPEEIPKKALKRYDVILDTRKFEIELFWKRSLFFWGFIATAFVGYITLYEDNSKGYNLAHIVVTCFGLICSFAWYLVNKGSKYWQENWEGFLADAENEVTGSLFKDRYYSCKQSFSPSRGTIYLSGFTTVLWLILLLDMAFDFQPIEPVELLTYNVEINAIPFLALLACIAILLYLYHSLKSRDSNPHSRNNKVNSKDT